MSTLDNQPLTLRRLQAECELRRAAIDAVNGIARKACLEFAAFLLSPGVIDQLRKIDKPPRSLRDIIEAGNSDEAADALLTLTSGQRKELARLLGAALGGKTAKTVRLSSFTPRTTLVWESGDIESVVDEFREFLAGEWEETSYLKVEK